MIEKERIEEIKRGVDLVALVESRGVKLKKTGKGYAGLCPFHEDHQPSLSINIEKNLWQCFGCGKAGDVISFVELYDKVDFPHAIALLDGAAKTDDRKPATDAKTEEYPSSLQPATRNPSTVKQQKLLAKVVAYYQHTFATDTRGLNYLKTERGINDNQSFKDFSIGFVNGTLLEVLPSDDEVIGALKKVGILTLKNYEFFNNCVVFPLCDQNGATVGLYGRSIDQESTVPHLYLPGPRAGIVNRQAVKRSQSIILTESIIDALTLYDQGFKNVVPVYGVNGLIDDHLALFHRRIKEAYLCFDADEAGKAGAEAVALRLKEKEIAAYTITLPIKDVNLFFKRHTPEEFEALMKQANPHSLEQSEKISKRQQSLFHETEHGFLVGYGDRQYEIKGIQRGDTQLKATIKASKDLAANLPFELTTIDLYSSRSRLTFSKLCADLFGASEELVREDLGKLLILVEGYKPKEQKKDVKEASAEEQAQALALLKNPDIFSEILSDMETLGVTGEETNC